MPYARTARIPILVCVLCAPLLLGPGCAMPVGTESKVLRIAPAQAQALIQQHLSDTDFVILDVRDPDEFAAGHIAGAVNVCFRCGTFLDELATLDRSKTYLVYCASGNRSGQATSQMDRQGFLHVYDLAGGINQWKADGFPVVK